MMLQSATPITSYPLPLHIYLGAIVRDYL